MPPARERMTRPAAASSIDSSAVRSSPIRWAMAGVATPNTANAALGSMPSTPVIVAPNPNTWPRLSSSGVSEVTAVRRLNADSTMPASTSARPSSRPGLADGGRVACRLMRVRSMRCEKTSPTKKPARAGFCVNP